MNYLAHMLCSNDSPLSKLGNFLADFVKGDVEGRFPAEVVAGIRHHRRADYFTDSHEVFAASRRLVSSPRRRYAGVIVDVLYDHFLATNWDRYCSTGLDEFVGRVYEDLARSAAVVPHPVPWIIGKMAAEDWLRSYRTADGIDRTFRRISRRIRRENPLATAAEELELNYDLFRDHFHSFFPQAVARFRACGTGRAMREESSMSTDDGAGTTAETEMARFFHNEAFERNYPGVTVPPPCFIASGGRIVSHEPNRSLTVAFTVREDQTNPVGSLQGGILCSFFDDTFGPLAFRTTAKPCVSIGMTVNFIRQARSGETVLVRAEFKARSRTLLQLYGEAYNGRNKLLATATSNMMIYEP